VRGLGRTRIYDKASKVKPRAVARKHGHDILLGVAEGPEERFAGLLRGVAGVVVEGELGEVVDVGRGGLVPDVLLEDLVAAVAGLDELLVGVEVVRSCGAG
jgi:hypothetical protein